MNTLVSRSRPLLLLVALCLPLTAQSPSPEADSRTLARIQKEVDDVRKQITDDVNSRRLAELADDLEQLRAETELRQEPLRNNLTEIRTKLSPLVERLDSLRAESEQAEAEGTALTEPPAAGHDPAAAARARLTAQLQHLDSRRAGIRRQMAPLNRDELALQTRLDQVEELLREILALQGDLGELRQTRTTGEELDQLADEAGSERLEIETLQELLRRATALRERSTARVASLSEQVTEVRDQLKVLGGAAPEESEEVTARRGELAAVRKRLEQALSDSRLNLLEAQTLADTLQTRIQDEATATLLERGTGVVGLTLEAMAETEQATRFAHRAMTRGSGFGELRPIEQVLAAAGLLLAALLGLWLQARLRASAEKQTAVRFGGALLKSFLGSLSRHLAVLLVLLTVVGITAQIAARTDQRPALMVAAYALLLFLAVRIVNRTLLAPFPPAKPLTPLPREQEFGLARRITVLTLVAVLGYVLFTTARELEMPQPIYLLARAIFVAMLAVNLVWLLWLVGRLPRIARYGRYVRAAALVLVSVSFLAELLGYRNLSDYLLRGVIGTMLFSPLLWIVRRLADELLDGLHYGSQRWLRAPRRWLGLAPGEELPGVGWLRFVAWLGLWVGSLLLLIRIWTSPTGFHNMISRMREGIPFGSLVIEPDKAIAGLIVFAWLMAATYWIATGLRNSLARKGRMDQGARAAVATLATYLGFVVAMTMAVTTIGLDLTKLAVVFGALSVGIGFGLQNIVNNFVSGLILLFERPIKVGDFIEVGGAEGYVRKMSVRSTEIQTLSKEELIIPNSDLISEHVMNRTKHDARYRIIIPIGVAYGTRTRRVKELLEEIAGRHPDVLQDKPNKPVVFFRAFGDSSLDFELRCMLDDVEKRFKVISDLLFDIDDAFRENELEIPFPQRDLWVRGLPTENTEPSEPVKAAAAVEPDVAAPREDQEFVGGVLAADADSADDSGDADGE